jgi:hypothetical protein
MPREDNVDMCSEGVKVQVEDAFLEHNVHGINVQKEVRFCHHLHQSLSAALNQLWLPAAKTHTSTPNEGSTPYHMRTRFICYSGHVDRLRTVKSVSSKRHWVIGTMLEVRDTRQHKQGERKRQRCAINCFMTGSCLKTGACYFTTFVKDVISRTRAKFDRYSSIC